MKKTRKQYSPEFKAKVAIEAISQLKTIQEIASEYEVHPQQITNWKNELLKNANELFSDKRKKRDESKDELIEKLYTQIGQREVELSWMKKKVGLIAER